MKKIKFKNIFNGIFKKNEFVIYAIALMLVTAGYLNYSTNIKDKSLETSSNSNIVNNSLKEAGIGDARLVNSNDLEENNKISNNEDKEENPIDVAINTEEPNEEINENQNIEETSTVLDDNSNYFANSRLERETRFASMISTYTKILEDNSISETQKSIAMQEITKINNSKNAISVCENILSTKGFTNNLILVNNDSINVVIEKDKNLEKAEVAQIQNIISREFSTDIEKIHITERNIHN